MSTKSIILSSCGLRNIVISSQLQEEEFRFINGDQEIKMPKILAEFLSPRVSHLHQCDPTIDHLNFKELLHNMGTKTTQFDEILNENTKESIKRLISGQYIEIDENNFDNLRRLSVLLNNEELFKQINLFNEKEKTIDERLDEIILYYEISGETFSFESTKMIDDIASQISTDDKEKMKKIPLKILYSILKNEHFKAKDEDSLIDIINEIYSEYGNENENENDNYISYIELYETIDLKKLSENKFNEFVAKFDFNQMTAKMWDNFCECFFATRTNKNDKEVDSDDVKDKEITIEYDGNSANRFKGIINSLRGNKKINIADEGIVSVTASSTEGSHLPKYAVDFDSNEFFHSDESGDWLQIDFKDKKIHPTHYSIQTPSNHDDGDVQFPVNWNIEVSNSGNENDWRTIDSRQNVTSISKRNQSDTFDIVTRLTSKEYYRYIRLRATGDTSGGGYSNIAFSSLEFFGTLTK